MNGLAVDAKTGRLFLLATDLRAETDTIDKTQGEKASEAVTAASTLYSFKTAELAPAGETHLEPQSNTPGVALLEPQGITVDPATEEVIVLAHVDTTGSSNDSLKAEGDHFVLQRIKPGVGPGGHVRGRDQQVQRTRRQLHPEPHLAHRGRRDKAGEEHVMVDWAFGLTEVPLRLQLDAGAGDDRPLAALPRRRAVGENEQEGLLAGAPAPIEPESSEAPLPVGRAAVRVPRRDGLGPTDVKDEAVGSGLEAREGLVAMSALRAN